MHKDLHMFPVFFFASLLARFMIRAMHVGAGHRPHILFECIMILVYDSDSECSVSMSMVGQLPHFDLRCLDSRMRFVEQDIQHQRPSSGVVHSGPMSLLSHGRGLCDDKQV